MCTFCVVTSAETEPDVGESKEQAMPTHTASSIETYLLRFFVRFDGVCVAIDLGWSTNWFSRRYRYEHATKRRDDDDDGEEAAKAEEI